MADNTVVDVPDADRFEVWVDGVTAGFAAYRRDGNAIAFTHTEIDPRFEGQGLGSVLARGALDAAREGGLAVAPFCPFVRGYIARHPEYLDLVPAALRDRFELPGEEHVR